MGKFWLPGYEPADAKDLLVPMARLFHVPTNPLNELKKMIGDLSYRMGGRAAKPNAPIVIKMMDGSTSIIPGFGVTEAAELEDMAYQQLEKKREDWRTRFGFPERETFDTRIREHMDWRNKNPEEHPEAMTPLERETRRRQIPNG